MGGKSQLPCIQIFLSAFPYVDCLYQNGLVMTSDNPRLTQQQTLCSSAFAGMLCAHNQVLIYAEIYTVLPCISCSIHAHPLHTSMCTDEHTCTYTFPFSYLIGMSNNQSPLLWEIVVDVGYNLNCHICFSCTWWAHNLKKQMNTQQTTELPQCQKKKILNLKDETS